MNCVRWRRDFFEGVGRLLLKASWRINALLLCLILLEVIVSRVSFLHFLKIACFSRDFDRGTVDMDPSSRAPCLASLSASSFPSIPICALTLEIESLFVEPIVDEHLVSVRK